MKWRAGSSPLRSLPRPLLPHAHQSLHQRATTAESLVAVLQGEKADLQARVDELLRALRDERTKRSLQELAEPGDKPVRAPV